jgi:hypothetical protein
MGNTKGAAGKAGHAYPSGAPDVTFIYLRVCIVQALVLSVVFFYDSVFVPHWSKLVKNQNRLWRTLNDYVNSHTRTTHNQYKNCMDMFKFMLIYKSTIPYMNQSVIMLKRIVVCH